MPRRRRGTVRLLPFSTAGKGELDRLGVDPDVLELNCTDPSDQPGARTAPVRPGTHDQAVDRFPVELASISRYSPGLRTFLGVEPATEPSDRLLYLSFKWASDISRLPEGVVRNMTHHSFQTRTYPLEVLLVAPRRGAHLDEKCSRRGCRDELVVELRGRLGAGPAEIGEEVEASVTGNAPLVVPSFTDKPIRDGCPGVKPRRLQVGWRRRRCRRPCRAGVGECPTCLRARSGSRRGLDAAVESCRRCLCSSSTSFDPSLGGRWPHVDDSPSDYPRPRTIA